MRGIWTRPRTKHRAAQRVPAAQGFILKRVLKRLVAVALLTLAFPTAAVAAVGVRGVDLSRYPKVRVTVVTPSRLDAPFLREDGARPAALRIENLARRKSVALLVDRSRSMIGQPLADAVAAGEELVRRKASSDRVAVFAFGSRAVQLTGFSSVPDDVHTMLQSLAVDARQGTALYDAIALAARALEPEPGLGRVIVVVTDGTDVSNNVTMAGAISAARAAGVSVYTVGIEGAQFSSAALRAIARATGGIYRGASSSRALVSVYASIASELRRTWLLEYATAGRPGDRLRLAVGTPGDPATLLTVTVPGPRARGDDSALPAAMYGPAGIAAFVAVIGFIALLAVGFVNAGFRSGRLRSRLAAHVGEPTSRQKRRHNRERLGMLAGLFRATERAFSQTRPWHSVQRLLDRADLPLRTVEFAYVALGTSFGLGLLAAVAGASPIVILFLFALGGAIPFGVVAFKARRRHAAFEAQLPDLLISLAASLKAGHSFKQGIQAAVDEGLEPTGKELKRVLTEVRLGRSMEQSLAEMADRIGSKDFAFVITAVNIQNQVGGSLATLFDMVADTVRQRQQFARKFKSLTAMGRMSAYVLIGLPFFLAAALTALNAEYMSPLYHSSTGHKLIFASLLMMAIGSVLLKKIVAFRG